MVRMLATFALAAAFLAGSTISAEEKAKEEKFEGTITCPKCDLGTADKCGTVLKVKDKIYTFDAASNKKYHGEICKAAKEGTVTGTVKKDGDNLIISVTKLEFKK